MKENTSLVKTVKKSINCNPIGYSFFSGAIYVLCFVTILLAGPLCMKDVVGQVSANENGKTLILNSNMSVKKYSILQSEFKKKFGKSTVEVDIEGSKWEDEDWFEDTIYEEDPDLILCIGSKAYLLAYKVAKKTDIIFSLGINWQRFPLTKKTYIIASELPPINTLMIYRYFFPGIKKFGILYSEKNKEWFNKAVADAKEVDVEIIGISIEKGNSIKATALHETLSKVDALWLISDPVVLSSRDQVEDIFRVCNAMRKPVFAYDKLFADFGAAFIISADIPTMGRQTARMAANILAHKEIVNKVQNPAGSYTAINLEIIEDYRIKLNSKALSTINDFIQ